MRTWRRQATEQVVLAWRAERDAVLQALAREDVPAAVGPYEKGWTLARVLVNGTEVVEPREREVVDLLDDLARTLSTAGAACLHGDLGARLLLVVAPGHAPVCAPVPGVDSDEAPSRGEWADVLRVIDRLPALEDVLAAAAVEEPAGRRHRTAALVRDRRAAAVSRAAGVPEGLLDPDAVDGPAPTREVVLSRHADPDVQVVASALSLPLRRVHVDGVDVVFADDLPGQTMLPVAAGLGAGRRSTLVLWRQGQARGYQLVRRGDVLDSHVWNTAWEVVLPTADIDDEKRSLLHEALAPAHGDAALLLEHLAVGPSEHADLMAGRSLLRRPPDDQVLSDLCRLLDLPLAAAALVEDRPAPALAAAAIVTPGSTRRAIYASATAPRPGDPWFLRARTTKPWWWRLWNLAWVAVALAWVGDLWSGGALARTGAALLLVTAVLSLVDAVVPARALPPRDEPVDVGQEHPPVSGVRE